MRNYSDTMVCTHHDEDEAQIIKAGSQYDDSPTIVSFCQLLF